LAAKIEIILDEILQFIFSFPQLVVVIDKLQHSVLFCLLLLQT